MNMKKLSALDKLARRAAPVVDEDGKAVAIPLAKIRFDSTQPRQAFHHPDGRVAPVDEDGLTELAESIEEHGLIHPITVEPVGDGTYLVVVGERRTRAYLKLGRPTILAKIREDLTNPKKRLIYQVAENVNRQDLSDADLAKSIRSLMEGTDEVAPMNQSQIAKALGKSEGWVSRYVKFGDEEQQRLWVLTGIADTVEKLYRLSILPMPMQAEIQRRVQLTEDDPEYLAKPLLRSVIDGLAQEVKAAKRFAAMPPPSQGVGVAAAPRDAAGTTSAQHGGGHGPFEAPSDPVARAFAEMAQQGQPKSEKGRADATQPGTGTPSAGYTLSDDARAKILNAASVTVNDAQKMVAQPPVTIRVPMTSLQALLQRLEPSDQDALTSLQLSVNLPGPLAERIANTLAGVMVSPSEVTAVVQNELAKLQ